MDDEFSVLVDQVVQDIGDGRCFLRVSFSTLEGVRRSFLVPREHIARPTRVVKALLERGARLPPSLADATKMVSAALSSATGWCGRTFVLPEKSIGSEHIQFLGETSTDGSMGLLADWKADLRGPCNRSTFLTFGVALGPATPGIVRPITRFRRLRRAAAARRQQPAAVAQGVGHCRRREHVGRRHPSRAAASFFI
jgi:hypothetical protein